MSEEVKRMTPGKAYTAASADMDRIGELTQELRRLPKMLATELKAEGLLNQPRYMDVRAAAHYMGRTDKAVYHLIEKKEIKARKPDGKVQIDRLEIDRWFEAGQEC